MLSRVSKCSATTSADCVTVAFVSLLEFLFNGNVLEVVTDKLSAEYNERPIYTYNFEFSMCPSCVNFEVDISQWWAGWVIQ